MATSPIMPGGLQGIKQATEAGKSQQDKPVDGAGFKQFLTDNLNRVNEMQVDADKAVENLINGKETDITKVMGAVEKADVAFKTLMAVRNKLVESYQDILRMRV